MIRVKKAPLKSEPREIRMDKLKYAGLKLKVIEEVGGKPQLKTIARINALREKCWCLANYYMNGHPDANSEVGIKYTNLAQILEWVLGICDWDFDELELTECIDDREGDREWYEKWMRKIDSIKKLGGYGGIGSTDKQKKKQDSFDRALEISEEDLSYEI